MSWCLKGVAWSCRQAEVGALLQSLKERSWLVDHARCPLEAGEESAQLPPELGTPFRVP